MNNKPEKKRSKAKLIIRLCLALVIIAIIAMIMYKNSKTEPEKAVVEEQPTPVSVIRAQAENIDNILILPARLHAFHDILLPMEKAGTVTELYVNKGDIVTNGQVLMKIDDRTWIDAQKQAAIDIREAKKDLERWEELHKTGAVSKADYEDYRTAVENAEIAQNIADINLERSRIISPIDGMINDRMIDIGEYANTGDPVFQVLDLETIKLSLDIPEQQIGKIHKGDIVSFTVQALPETVYTAKVSFIASKADPDSNAFHLEAVTANIENNLKAGMIAEAVLMLGNIKDAIVIPLASIVPDKGDYIVYTVDENNRAKRNVVRIDAIQDSRAVIGSGIENGDHIVVEGHRSLTDGVLTEIIENPSDSR